MGEGERKQRLPSSRGSGRGLVSGWRRSPGEQPPAGRGPRPGRVQPLPAPRVRPGVGGPCTVTLSGDPPEARPGLQPRRRPSRPSLRARVRYFPRVPGGASLAPVRTPPPTPADIRAETSRCSPLLSLHAARGDLEGFPGATEPATRAGTGSRCLRTGAGSRPRQVAARAGSGVPWRAGSGLGLPGHQPLRPGPGVGGGEARGLPGGGRPRGAPPPHLGTDGRARSGWEGARGRPPSRPAKLAGGTPVFQVHFSSIFLPVHFWVPLTEH